MAKRKTMIIYRAPVMCFILHADILLPKLEVHIIVPVLQIRRLRLKASRWLTQVTPTSQDLNSESVNSKYLLLQLYSVTFPFYFPCRGQRACMNIHHELTLPVRPRSTKYMIYNFYLRPVSFL